jgi:hypothetical protein
MAPVKARCLVAMSVPHSAREPFGRTLRGVKATRSAVSLLGGQGVVAALHEPFIDPFKTFVHFLVFCSKH